jgi:hypothetical protein
MKNGVFWNVTQCGSCKNYLILFDILIVNNYSSLLQLNGFSGSLESP